MGASLGRYEENSWFVAECTIRLKNKDSGVENYKFLENKEEILRIFDKVSIFLYKQECPCKNIVKFVLKQ